MTTHKWPKLTIRRSQNGNEALTMYKLDVRINDWRVPHMRSIQLTCSDDDVNIVRLDFVVGELDIDCDALLELKTSAKEPEEVERV